MSKLVILTLLLFSLVAMCVNTVVRAEDAPDARAILKKAIEAAGGEKELTKIKAAKCKGSLNPTLEIPVDIPSGPSRFTWQYNAPDQSRTEMVVDDREPPDFCVVNGKDGWHEVSDGKAKRKPKTERMNDVEFQVFSDINRLTAMCWLVPLLGKDYKLSTETEDTKDAGKYVGIVVKQKGESNVKLYFDKETYLLAKCQRKIDDPLRSKKESKVLEAVFYSDYKTVGKVKQPYKFEVFWDKQDIATSTISEREFFEKPLDEKLFERP